MKAEGVKVGELQIKLLQKIEELTLYTISQQKIINKQQQLLKERQEENEELKTRIQNIEQVLIKKE